MHNGYESVSSSVSDNICVLRTAPKALFHLLTPGYKTIWRAMGGSGAMAPSMWHILVLLFAVSTEALSRSDITEKERKNCVALLFLRTRSHTHLLLQPLA